MNFRQAKSECKNNELMVAIEQSQASVVITNCDNLIEYVNPSFCKLTGYTFEESIGKNPRILQSKKTEEKIYIDLWKTLENNKTWKGEFVNRKKNGDLYNELATISPITDKNNKITGYVAVKENITERVKEKRALKLSEARFKLLSDASNEAIFIAKDGVIVDVNKPAIKLTQYSRVNLAGSSPLDYIDKSYHQEVYKKIIENCEKPYEALGIRKDGDKIPVEIQGKSIDVDGVTYRITAVRDISDKKNAEKKLLEAQEEHIYKIINAEEKERGRISFDLHDGLGPDLSSLKLHIYAIKNARSETERNNIIEKSIHIIEQSMVNLRCISRALSPHILKDFGVDTAVNEFCNEIKLSDIKIDYESNIREERFRNEIELSVYRVIKELINNSVKHSKAKNIKILIINKENILRVDFSDNGIGFELEKLLFSDKIHLGSGLKNMKSRVESIKGSFEMISEEGKGLEVKIRIPI